MYNYAFDLFLYDIINRYLFRQQVAEKGTQRH